jgi:hypothetical protein
LLGIEAENIQKQMKDRMERARLSNRGGNSEEIGTVLYDQILMVDNSLGDKTYIFRVNHPNAENGKFYNMILQQNEIGSFMLKLFKYEMTPDFAFEYNSGLKQMKDFQGNYSYRLLANHNAVSIDGESGGGGGGSGGGDGGGSGGGSGSGNTNDGNTGSPTGGTPYDPTSGNTSSGVGSLGYGNPCPQGGGGINGSGGGSGNGGSGGGSGGGGLGDGSDGDGSGGQCFILSVSMQKINGANGCYFDLYYMFVACSGNGNRPATARDGEPCSSSNNGTVILPPPPNPDNLNPCDELAKIGEPSKMDLKPNLDALKTKVTSNNNKSENGFSTQKLASAVDGSFSYFTTNIFSLNATTIYLPVTNNHIGGGHSHPVNTYPMFSFGDVKALSEMYDTASPGRQKEVYYTLVCNNPTTGVHVYTIKVDEISVLQQNILDLINSTKYNEIADLDERTKKINDAFGLLYNKSSGDYEKSFLKQFKDFGISLYEATDNSYTKWSKLELDPIETNPVKKTPCP